MEVKPVRELEIIDNNVKVHIKNLKRKQNVRSRLEAAVRALGLGTDESSTWSLNNEKI